MALFYADVSNAFRPIDAINTNGRVKKHWPMFNTAVVESDDSEWDIKVRGSLLNQNIIDAAPVDCFTIPENLRKKMFGPDIRRRPPAGGQ